MNRVYAYSDSIFYGSGTFESGLIAKCNQKEILNQYLPFPQTEQAVNRDVNYLLFQGDLIMKPDKNVLLTWRMSAIYYLFRKW